MRTLYSLFLLVSLSLFSLSRNAQSNYQKQLQTQLIMAEDGDTITLPAGTLQFTASLLMDEKSNVVTKRAGMDKTILSFKGQSEGAEGLRIQVRPRPATNSKSEKV